ncbi:MAG TPA: NAD(P)-dependent alcohol dehydrogenase [Gemmatimonadaceae bacterium]|nr:NAD(P)-dependent alcohol dehydrogenase [Gemmatimonadaceae bacterium]
MSKPPRRVARIIRLLARVTLGVVVLAIVAGGVAWMRSDNECPAPGSPVEGDAMRGYLRCDYGPPSVLRLASLSRPVPADSEVLVRIHAVSLNPADWHELRGTPAVARIGMGLRKPAGLRIGSDFAGVVELVGSRVSRFQPGDSVWGARTGAFAEYVTVREGRLMPKPARITLEQAAAIPVAAVTALQGVRDQGGVRSGQRVLVNGASGGVGTFAVQVAKAMGAHVTGVCSSRNVALVQSLGADRVIDYTTTDFTTLGERYDVIVDMVGNHSLSALGGVLASGGTYVMVGGPKGDWIDPLPRAAATVARGWIGKERWRFFIASFSTPDLTYLNELVESGRMTPVVDRTYPFDSLPAAMEYLESGRARGKVVVRVP